MVIVKVLWTGVLLGFKVRAVSKDMRTFWPILASHISVPAHMFSDICTVENTVKRLYAIKEAEVILNN